MSDLVMTPLNEIGAALAKAQAEMSNPKFDKTNPHFRNKFASLAAVRDAVVPVLAKNGISCLQDLRNVTGGVACSTILLHTSGQSITFGPLEMPVSKNDAQGFGSAATYARRYHLMAVANVVGDEDDDANSATGKPAAAVGIGFHDPAGDLGKKIDTKLSNKWATALVDAQDNPQKLASIWLEVKADHDLAKSVWSTLPRAMKDRISDADKEFNPRS